MKKKILSTVISGAVIQFILGAMYSWSVYRIHIAKHFPEMTATDLSLVFTIAVIFYCIGCFLGGKLYERFSVRSCLLITAALVLLGFSGVSLCEKLSAGAALPVLCVTFGAFFGGGDGFGYNICVSCITRIDPKRMGLYSGILLMSYAIGSLLFGYLAEWMIGFMSIFRMFLYLGVVFAALILLGSVFMSDTPHTDSPGAEEMLSDEGSMTPRQTLASRAFWLYFTLSVTNSAAGLLVINSAAGISMYFGMAAVVGLLISLCNGLFRPIAGALLDRLGYITCLFLFVFVRLLAGGALMVADRIASPVLACIGMFSIGACYGGGVTLGSKVVSSLFGPKYFSVNYSLATFCMLPGAFLGPLFSGILQDASGGGYFSTFVMMTVMNLLALGLTAAFRREARKLGKH